MRVDMRNKVLCNNGTYDITNGAVAPCESAGGVKNQISIAVKPTTDEVKQQNLNLASRGDVMTQEDKFYEMLGIKKTPSGSIGIQSRPLGRLLVAVVLVAGYFAYKKFKK